MFFWKCFTSCSRKNIKINNFFEICCVRRVVFKWTDCRYLKWRRIISMNVRVRFSFQKKSWCCSLSHTHFLCVCVYVCVFVCTKKNQKCLSHTVVCCYCRHLPKTAYVLYLIRRKVFWRIYTTRIAWPESEWMSHTNSITYSTYEILSKKCTHKNYNDDTPSRFVIRMNGWERVSFRFIKIIFFYMCVVAKGRTKSEQKFCVCSVLCMQFNTECADLAQHQWMVHKMSVCVCTCVCYAHVTIERKSEWFV